MQNINDIRAILVYELPIETILSQFWRLVFIHYYKKFAMIKNEFIV